MHVSPPPYIGGHLTMHVPPPPYMGDTSPCMCHLHLNRGTPHHAFVTSTLMGGHLTMHVSPPPYMGEHLTMRVSP
jgi:hypothetical protein